MLCIMPRCSTLFPVYLPPSFCFFPHSATSICCSTPGILPSTVYTLLPSLWLEILCLSLPKSTMHHAKAVCQRKTLNPRLDYYCCLLQCPSPWGKAPIITFLSASLTRFAWEEAWSCKKALKIHQSIS